MEELLRRFINEEEGQDLAEYALLLALIAIVVALALPGLATAITTTFGAVVTALT